MKLVIIILIIILLFIIFIFSSNNYIKNYINSGSIEKFSSIAQLISYPTSYPTSSDSSIPISQSIVQSSQPIQPIQPIQPNQPNQTMINKSEDEIINNMIYNPTITHAENNGTHSELSGSELSDSQMQDSELSDSQMQDSELSDSQISKTVSIPSTTESNIEIKKHDISNQGKCSVATCGLDNLHPILDPKFNMRETAKQCLLLEDHLNNIKKRCFDCIRKHFLIIDGFLEEAVSLEKDNTERNAYRALFLEWIKLEKQYALNPKDSDNLDELSKKIRLFRKPLVEKYFDTVSEYHE
jgi:hypothetical protein